MKLKILIALCAVASNAVAAPDEDALGKSRGYPRMTSNQYLTEQTKIGSMTDMEHVYKSVPVKAGSSDTIRVLHAMEKPPTIQYFINGQPKGLEDLLNENRITGLLMMKGDQIAVERYQYDRKADNKFNSYSMSKTIVGLLIGAALKDGKIKSLDDTAGMYVPDLKDRAYGNVSIRNLLRMSSGIKWNELGGGGSDDSATLGEQTYRQKGSGGVSAVKHYGASDIAPGTKWNYNSGDSFVLGLVIRGATGKTVAEYTSEKLWKNIGAEGDAVWNVDYSGTEAVQGYFSARLRDYARLALFMAEGAKGVVDGQYMMEMTDNATQPDYLKQRTIWTFYGYGYQTWLLPYKTRTFAFNGSWGQYIIVQPETKTVIVMTRAEKAQHGSVNDFRKDIAMFHGLLRSMGAHVEMYPVVK